MRKNSDSSRPLPGIPFRTPLLTPSLCIPSTSILLLQIWSPSPEGLQLHCPGCLHVLKGFKQFPLQGHFDLGESQESHNARSSDKVEPRQCHVLGATFLFHGVSPYYWLHLVKTLMDDDTRAAAESGQMGGMTVLEVRGGF